MRYIWMSLIMMFLAIALAACQSAASPAQVLPETQAETAMPGSLPQNSVAQTPTFPQEDTVMTPATPPDEAAEKMVALVKGHLAQRLNIAADQIVLSDVKAVIWRDASLGCPKPGVDYIQMETPGYTIFLEANGKTYNYHTDEIKRFVLCNQ